MSELNTHYDRLQVVESASPEVIKGAYKYLSQKWHPDKNPQNRAEAERRIGLINEAYTVLSDARTRKEYDAWLKGQRDQRKTSRAKDEASARTRDGWREAAGKKNSTKADKWEREGTKKSSKPKDNPRNKAKDDRVRSVPMGQGSGGNVLAAICSLFIPGLGQLVQGRPLMAVVMFVLAPILWLVLLGWVIHLWSIIDAARFDPGRK